MCASKKDRYDAIKVLCCYELGVPSQCVVSKSIQRKQTVLSVCNKIIQQINCKLGGQLWQVNGMPPESMIVGVDVCHDKSSGHGRRSVAGYCATTNSAFTQYFSATSYQNVGQELVDGLANFMINALKNFQSINKKLPKWIFIFRDGVGDGMLQSVLEHEVAQVTKACDTVYANEAEGAKYCYVIVKKRIHTRIFTAGRVENPPPGTVVDKQCTFTPDNDFFLVSQSVRQGTVTPAHYHILHDTIKLKRNQLQKLTYMLCHLYYNWPGTIRVPAPCHYAHKISFLIGQSVHTDSNAALSNNLE